MTEETVDITKASGLCEHGNFPATCPQCKKSESGIVRREYKEGLPVINAEDYEKMYSTDIRAAGSDKSATFDFQGFIKDERDDYEKGFFYKDAMATNGILKEEGEHNGIHVGTDGIIDYNMLLENHRMESSADVGEYDIYITVPGKLQKEKGVVCLNDSCQPASEFEDDEAELERAQSGEGWIVMRLGLDPKDDSLARRKVQFIHEQIVKFIERGGDLSEIEKRTRELESQLMDLDEKDLTKKMKLLEAGK